MQRWEYKVTGYLRGEELNLLGNQGWELVAVETTDMGETILYFKRPVR